MSFKVVVTLAAALPLLLACPCPPAPAGLKVCGSDLVTYDSQCHLECAANPGLSLKHPGPCSATEERTRWYGCEEERQCGDAADCGCGKGDEGCKDMYRWNCRCGCGGYQRGGMDRDLWKECLNMRRCGETYYQCREGCGGEECVASCDLDSFKCGCECVHQAYPAPQRKRNWTACLERDQCHNTTCGECAGDPFCAERCKKRCRCACAGHLQPRRDLSGEWEECFIGTQTCEQAHEECTKKCRDQDCRDKCAMTREDCSCECRSATEEEWRLWGECKEKELCEYQYKACSECLAGDLHCRERCRRNCGCRCLGINADSLDDASVQQCETENGCQTTRTSCLRHCDALSDKAKRKECKHACILSAEKCACECARSRPTSSIGTEE